MSEKKDSNPDLHGLEVRSECSSSSSSSRRSSKSSVSNAAAHARAKAEAARMRAVYAKQEIAMKVEKAQIDANASVEKARIDATLIALKEECEAEAASAEAQVLEAAIDVEINEHCSKVSQCTSHRQSLGRTSEYIQTHFASQQVDHPTQPSTVKEEAATSVPQHVNTINPEDQSANKGLSTPGSIVSHSQPQQKPRPQFNIQPNVSYTTLSPPKHPQFNDDVCKRRQSVPNLQPRSSNVSDLAIYLARRDLVTAGLKTFDNQPANYLSWKSSFLNATEGLDLKPSEQLDLLIKWLSGEALQHANRIRAVHINQPDIGLDMVWQRLDRCYGSPEAIEASLFSRLEKFPRVAHKSYVQLQELADLLLEIEAAKCEGYLPGLSFLDTARGINPIVEKLPYNLQEQWISQGFKYKREYDVPYPPFSFFVDFVRCNAEMRTDPSFSLPTPNSVSLRTDKVPSKRWRDPVTVSKTKVEQQSSSSMTKRPATDPEKECPIHKKPHSLRKCRGFREKPIEERMTFLKEHFVCFRCCASTAHQAKACKAVINCSECDSNRHVTALHAGPAPWVKKESEKPPVDHGGEHQEYDSALLTSTCTEVCGQGFQGKSCSKICLVHVYPEGHPEKKAKMYVVLDDQSNVSMARSAFFDIFNVHSDSFPYTLKTCSGTVETAGRRAVGFMVESADGDVHLRLPTLIECNQIPNNREEIPTPEAAHSHPHLRKISNKIPPLDPSAEILMLLGRDIIRVHKVRSQRNGKHNAPYAQQLDLGWVIIGDVCLGGAHRPVVNVFKTNVLENGRHSYLTPCENSISVREKLSHEQHTCSKVLPTHTPLKEEPDRQFFNYAEDSNKIALSIEDEKFLHIMDKEFVKDETNSWVAPLPFRVPRQRLPNNRAQALTRLMSLRRTLQKKQEMKDHFVAFMEKIFINGHAEPAPPLESNTECWYLPSFGVYHPQKLGQIRIVFDSSAKYGGVSLNDVLLQGPDMNNSLLGVLIRFRKEPVAVMADVEQMYYSFMVREDHRNFLRFLWFHDHDLDSDVVEYRMKVHVFGNCPSPAVAMYGLKRSAIEGEKTFGAEVRQFIEKHFYVDDGLKSFPCAEEAINVLSKAKDMLAQSNIRLHKIVSNNLEVVRAFSGEDLAKGLQDLDVGHDLPPMQRSLGLRWDISKDTFTFKVTDDNKPFTRRGVLSTINSLFDPLGFAAPVSVQGRFFLRQLTSDNQEWDAPLPAEKYTEWQQWTKSLKDLEELKIPRLYTTLPVSAAQKKEVCVFCDASNTAIGAVAYLKVTDTEGKCHVGFIFGKAKLAPKPELTIPRLELCAAVLAVEIAEIITEELDTPIDDMKFFTDSKVVLGYIFNESRRFYVYVHNRVHRIRRSTQPSQWNYVPTSLNPADHATRPLSPNQLALSSWLIGPAFLSEVQQSTSSKPTFPLVDPTLDTEIRPEVTVKATQMSDRQLGSARFERFSSWKSVTRALAHLMHIAQSFTAAAKNSSCHGWHVCNKPLLKELEQAKASIMCTVQRDVFADEIECVNRGNVIQKHSSLAKLCPFVDSQGVLRVGGRLRKSQFTQDEMHPVIVPGRHHITKLLIRHYHQQVHHQGRHFTEGSIRTAGFWIVGGKRAISNLIHNCVICRRLRGKTQEQKMGDLPVDRLSTEPPFTYVGLDIFGPWSIISRRTRGSCANKKCWAVIFTCMSTRAIHIEVVETMEASSFINALRRLFAIRGAAKQLRSDCGTNFVGACKELQITANGCNNKEVESYLTDQGCTWIFNPPHSSHMGGSWERMIGIARRILDAMLLHVGSSRLTFEVLVTFMAEVTAIVNSRPLISVSTDPDQPLILTPAMLLTQKVGTPPVPPGDFDNSDLFRRQWRQVQYLANTFWERWRKEYASVLQDRCKWKNDKRDLKEGDIVLLKDNQAKRHDWPVGLIVKTFPSADKKVRKVEVKISRGGTHKQFLRPITEVILLLPEDGNN